MIPTLAGQALSTKTKRSFKSRASRFTNSLLAWKKWCGVEPIEGCISDEMMDRDEIAGKHG